MVVLDNCDPYTSARCAAMSPGVIPRADRDNTMSSIDPSRRRRFATILASTVPARSRGTSTGTGPAVVTTVFARVPLRALPSVEPPRVAHEVRDQPPIHHQHRHRRLLTPRVPP